MNLSITIPVYERYKQTYQKNKEPLIRKGITSFAGYITSTLEEMMEKNEVFARLRSLHGRVRLRRGHEHDLHQGQQNRTGSQE